MKLFAIGRTHNIMFNVGGLMILFTLRSTHNIICNMEDPQYYLQKVMNVRGDECLILGRG